MQYKLPPVTTLGRASTCEIQVSPKLSKVSRKHAQIKVYKGGMYVLYDKSSAGTFVNGKRQQQIVLHDGDRISLAGVVEFQFFKGTLSSSSKEVRITRPVADSYGSPPPLAPIQSHAEIHDPPFPYSAAAQQKGTNAQHYLPTSERRVSSGYRISISGALVAIMFFFSPWVITSCGDVEVEQTGWDLAAGTTISYGFGTERIPGDPTLFIVFLAAFLVFPLFYLANQRGMLQPLLDGVGLIAIGTVPLFVLLLFYFAKQSEASEASLYGINVDYQFGLFGVILGYIAIIIGGVLNLLGLRSSPRSSPAHFR